MNSRLATTLLSCFSIVVYFLTSFLDKLNSFIEFTIHWYLVFNYWLYKNKTKFINGLYNTYKNTINLVVFISAFIMYLYHLGKQSKRSILKIKNEYDIKAESIDEKQRTLSSKIFIMYSIIRSNLIRIWVISSDWIQNQSSKIDAVNSATVVSINKKSLESVHKTTSVSSTKFTIVE